jgi:hypothetical protein
VEDTDDTRGGSGSGARIVGQDIPYDSRVYCGDAGCGGKGSTVLLSYIQIIGGLTYTT